MNIKWDADKYTKDFSFVHQYGNGVVELIDCEKGGTLIDLGCGNGALAKVLQEKGFRVTGMDSSEELLETARGKYPDIPFIQADATDFSVEEAIDVVFSNAVFHWIDREKQAVLFDRPTELKGSDGLKEWIHMFVKTPFATVDDVEEEEIICQTVERLRNVLYREGRWYADYVRIRMKVVKELGEIG